MQVSAIMTGHREGLLSGPSITSFREAIDHARDHGISVEPIVILDRPDAPTRTMFANADSWGAKVVSTDYGDPGVARNHGVSLASGKYVTFLDADDLWSFNWIVAAHSFCTEAGQPVIAHSQLNIIFGRERMFWLHVDSEHPDFDRDYLQIGNYWDALSFAPREIFADYPFHKNELASGYGHEDWHWNCVTLSKGFPHKPVPDTVHMKRRRHGSQSARANDSDVVPWPTDLVRFTR
jgi:glycosyltransferase involved in cell wall biosynthesis